jgi:DNA-binding IclR family transcriptional regulator
LSPEEIERLYHDPVLEQVTPRSLKTREALLADLAVTRERGYAVEDEECDLDVRSIAAPVRDFGRNVIAAIGIVAPANRLTDKQIGEGAVVARLQNAALALSRKLGFEAGQARK